MTATEEAAASAWALMFYHAMPPAIALDFVQERTDERGQALEALLVAGVAANANARPSVVHQEQAGSFPDFEAGKISGAILRHDYPFARTLLGNLLGRLHQQELNPTTSVTYLQEWIQWCADCTLALALCEELEAAAKPPGERT